MHPRKRQRKNASTMKLVGKLLARFRTEAGMTQVELALASGVQEDTIASIEQGRRSLVPVFRHVVDRRRQRALGVQQIVDRLRQIPLETLRLLARLLGET
ncbi:helix-turn-helix domain-containing protein [Streptomyces sp. TRM75563]|nr:helix-turn-helix transcriptional regulator [Streptomyces sp. TRM75563]MCI4039618.1 helix-turn-helix domain-containing protein [Streptomyces sp. TRM75563]